MITQSGDDELIGRAMSGLFDRSTDQGLLTFSLRLISGVYMLKVNKHAKWIQL